MASVAVVAHETRDLESWVLDVKFGGGEFLFGRFGEGAQRVLVDQGLVKLGRVRGVFVTGPCTSWTPVGGVAGFLIAGAAAGAGPIVYGGRNVRWAMATLRGVEFRQEVGFDVRYAQGEIVNEFMTVVPVELATATTDSGADEEDDIGRILDGMGSPGWSWPNQGMLRVPDSERRSMCFVIRPHARPGRLNVAEAERLGVPRGAAFGQLRKGMAVTTLSGFVVRPEMVIGPAEEQDWIVVVDLPTRGFFRAALDVDWATAGAGGGRNRVGTVMHILGPDIDPFGAEYIGFMKSFPRTCKHIVAHPSYGSDNVTLTRSARLRTGLAGLWPTVRFPMAVGSGHEPTMPSPGDVIVERAMAECVVGDVDEICRRMQAASMAGQSSSSSAYGVECICIGTGSGSPSVFRNVVGTIVRMDDGWSVLLDCGEGTYYGLRSMYGDDEDVLRSVKVVFISHMHADHHLGLLSFVDGWMRASNTDDDLYVIGPERIRAWLHDWSQMQDEFRDRVRFVDVAGAAGAAAGNMGLDGIETVGAIHCAQEEAYSVVLSRRGIKVAYSGDTRPNHDFVCRARNATVLVHESTFEDRHLADAIKKGHSTVGEALLVGMQMRASNVVLTHVSPRYAVESLHDKLADIWGIVSRGLLDEDEDGMFLCRPVTAEDRQWCERVKVFVGLDGAVFVI
ncbi:beta-lactamase-like protein [Lipomyces kononenkoae]